MNTVSPEQHELLSTLASISEMIEGYKATIVMLGRERLQLQTQLQLCGYRAPISEAPG